MFKRQKTNFLLLFFLLIKTLPLQAEPENQQNSNFQPVSALIIIDNQNNEKTAIQEEGIQLSQSKIIETLRNILSNELKLNGFQISRDKLFAEKIKQQDKQDLLLEKPYKLIQLGASKQLHLLLILQTKVKNDRFYVLSKLYDIKMRRLLFASADDYPLDLTLQNNIKVLASKLSPHFRDAWENFFAREWRERSPVLDIRSPNNGALVTINNAFIAGYIESGELKVYDFKIEEGKEITVRLQKAGFYDLEKKISIATDTLRLKMPKMRRISRFAAYLLYSSFQFYGAGIGFRKYLGNEYSFVSAQNYFYGQSTPNKNAKAPLHLDSRLCYGQYFLTPPQQFFRFNFESGLGLLLTFSPGKDLPVYTDWYINIAALNFELNFERLVFYAQMEFRYFLGLGNNLLGANMINEFSPGHQPIYSLGVVYKW